MRTSSITDQHLLRYTYTYASLVVATSIPNEKYSMALILSLKSVGKSFAMTSCIIKSERIKQFHLSINYISKYVLQACSM